MSNNNNTLFLVPEFDSKTCNISGEGGRGLLCITESDTFGDEEEITLKKLISAIKYDFNNDIYFLKINKGHSFSVGTLPISYKDMIVFGVLPDQLGLNIDYKWYDILIFDQTRILLSDSISDINKIPQKKQQLWVKLQQMFLQ
jgi:hypothetical protein